MERPHKHRFVLAALALALIVGSGGVRLADAQSSTAPSVIVAVSPYRILDTRLGIGTGGAVARVGQGDTITLAVAGVGPVPPNATGVVLNVTGTNATVSTYVSAWPNGEARQDTSVLNITPGIPSPNMITSALGTDGRLNLFNAYGDVDLIADVAGYLLPSGSVVGNPGVVTGTQTLTWSATTTTTWFTYSVDAATGWPARTATIAVPELTQAIIDRGSVELVFKPDASANRWAPLPYSQPSNLGWNRAVEYRYDVGVITVYWVHQATQTGVAMPPVSGASPPAMTVRWSLRPG